MLWGDRVRLIAREGNAVEPLVIDDFGVEPADDPVVARSWPRPARGSA